MEEARRQTKQPYAIGLDGGGLMALARLWEKWKSPAEEWVRSFTIITTTPNELCAEIHNRMPVILPPEAWSTWIGEEQAEPDELKSILVPYAGPMVAWPVSARVGNVKNNDPSLIEPVEPVASVERERCRTATSIKSLGPTSLDCK
jgi:putative SOS response-associated peptidase YedK